ncbi:MAG TPA: response regulator transcription factor [Thermoleophilaceae bacterium]|nr:response regulator transcription factor [Thermoleophilaceae bacterium]
MTELLVADDSPLWREGLTAVLEREGMRVVGKVGNAAALRAAIGTTGADVALVGIPIPTGGHEAGLAGVAKLSRPGVGILVLSGRFDPALAVRLIGRRPARVGYMLKAPLPDVATLVRAVSVVAGGGTFVDRAVLERLRSARSRPEPLDFLSGREREILTLMAEGRTNHAIHVALRLSPKTVESHVRAIFKKLELPAAPEDHRRVLAVLRYMQETEAEGRTQARSPNEPDHPDPWSRYAARAGHRAA